MNVRALKRMIVVSLSLVVGTLAVAQETRPTLRVALPALPASLDVGAGFSNPDHLVPYSLFDTLILKDHTSVQPVYLPGLAVSWERLSDTVTELKLRPDVVFHDGSAFTAEDVKYTFERFSDPEHAPYATPKAIAFGNFERIDVIDELTVHVVTVRPEPALEAILSMPQASILPSDYATSIGVVEFGRAPVGTGPYRITEFVPGERIVLEAFEGFWGDQPNAGGIVFRTIPELASRITALVNDEVDIVTHVPPDQIAVIDNAPCCDTRSILNNIFHVLYFNSQHPMLEDTKLRRAMSLAIDRELLVEALWGDLAAVPAGHQFAQYGEYYDAERPIPAYDPELARQLVQESSYEGQPITFNTSSTYYTNGLLAAQAVAEMWEAVGISVELLVDTATTDFWTETMVANWSNPLYFTDPAGAFGVMYAPGGFRGSDRWTGDHESYVELYDRFRYTLDVAERTELYGDLLDYWDEFSPATILYQPMEFYGVRSDVIWEPLPGSQTYILDFRSDNLSFDE